MEVMEIIEGVTIDIAINGRPVPILDGEGRIGRLKAGDDVLITVQVFPENIWGFTVDGKKNVVLKKDYVRFARKQREKCGYGDKATKRLWGMTGSEQGKQYRFQTTVQRGWDGVPYTPPAESSIRLLIFGAFKTSAEIWEISLVSQGGDFYIRASEQYRGELSWLNRGGVLECLEPRIDEWPQLMRQIEELL